MDGKLEKINDDLLEVIDDPVKLHRRVEYWHHEEPVLMEMIKDGVLTK